MRVDESKTFPASDCVKSCYDVRFSHASTDLQVAGRNDFTLIPRSEADVYDKNPTMSIHMNKNDKDAFHFTKFIYHDNSTVRHNINFILLIFIEIRTQLMCCHVTQINAIQFCILYLQYLRNVFH